MIAVLIKLIHFIVCIALIIIVLLQADKGEGLAGAFGSGASATIFGERGEAGIMTKLTTIIAIIFMLTSLIISIWLPRWEAASPKIELSSPKSVPLNMPVPGIPVDVTVPTGGTGAPESSSQAQ